MTVKIENLTNRPVLLRLNSGQSLHLAARTTTTEIPDVDVRNNARVEKLRDRHIIDLHEAKKMGRTTAIAEKKKTKPLKEGVKK